jgi:hypothetical protein
MSITRRTVIAGGGAAVALAAGRAIAVADANNHASPWAGSIVTGSAGIKAVLISAGADGKSKIEDIDVPPDKSVAPMLFRQFLTHKASATAIYQAPPRHAIAEAEPAKDLLFIVDGATTLETDGGSRKLGRGTFVLFDGIAKHTEKAGPAGYVAIKVRLAD